MINRKPYFLFLLSLFSFTAIPQPQYRVIQWDVEHGLSIGNVNCMLKDAHGFLWMGTPVGLNRFDGNHFVTYYSDKYKSGTIVNSYILSMVEDSLHNIWIGTRKGLSRYANRADTFSTISLPTNLTSSVYHIMPFWATKEEVFCIEKLSSITAFNIHTYRRRVIVDHFQNDWDFTELRPARSILDSSSNSVWMLAAQGLLQVSLSTGKQHEYTLACHRTRKFRGYGHRATSICFDRKRNSIWLNSSDGLIQFTLIDKKFHQMVEFNTVVNEKPRINGLSYYSTGGMGIDPYGRVWSGTTPHGILIYDPQTHSITGPPLSNLRENQNKSQDVQVSPNSLSPVYFDNEGIVWAKGKSTGIYQLNPINPIITNYSANPSQKFSLSDDHIATILTGPGDKLWLGTWDGINIFDPTIGLFQTLREKDLPGFQGRNIMPLAMDSSRQTTWLKSWPPEGLYEMDIATRECRKITIADRKGDSLFNAGTMVAEQAIPYKSGIIFPLFGRGIFQVAKGSLVAEFMIPVSWPIGRIVMVEDRVLFIKSVAGTDNVTYIEQNGKWVLKPSPLDTVPWTNIYFNTENRTYWVGSQREIIHYDINLHVIRRYQDGFPGFDVKSLMPDNSGSIWFVNGRSQISRLDTASGKFMLLSAKDGIQKQDFSWNHPHCKDFYGNLYYASNSGGMHKITPEKFDTNPHRSSVYLRSITINQKPFSPITNANYAEQLSLKHNENNISIETGIIDFFSEGISRIRYKLEGFNKDWQFAGNLTTISYDKLPPEKYKLIIQGSNAAGEFNGSERILFIQIQSPFWSTWWFRTIAFAILVASIYGLIRWRLHQRFQSKLKASEKERQLSELQREKTELEMQALRAQMNPHFIFNSLNSINRFILQNNKAQASEFLTKFSKLVRMILQNSQASLITLENELESLELYLNLEAVRFNDHFAYRISVPKDMDISVLKVPPLILQPYAENAIWHGLMHKEEQGKLGIEVLQENDQLLFKITDDGIGRKQAAALNSKSATKHKSVGLKITAERIAMMQGENGSNSAVTINDLVHHDGTAAGTEVIIRMPVLYE